MAPPRKASPEQLEQILGFMEVHPHVSTEGCKPEFKRSWKKLADTLNAMKDGAVKTPEKWSKCWNDWKFFVRKKAHKNIKMIGVEARLFEFLQKYGKKSLGPIKSKSSKEQLGILLNFMESQRMLSKSNDKSVTNWQKFSNVLNKLDSGTVKSPDEWEKCWEDWQAWVRKKASRNPEDPTCHMSVMETRVWSLMEQKDDSDSKDSIKRDPGSPWNYVAESVQVDDPLIASVNAKFFDENLDDNNDGGSIRNDDGNSDDDVNENETVVNLIRQEQRRLEIEEAKLRIKEKRLKLEERRLVAEERRNEILERIDEKLGNHLLGRLINGDRRSPT